MAPTPTIQVTHAAPSIESLPHRGSTITLVDPPTRSTSRSTSRSDDTSDIDSIWTPDYEERWEMRRREEDAALEELRDNAPPFTLGFAVSPGMSRRTSKQSTAAGTSRFLHSGRTSKASSAVDLGKMEESDWDLPRHLRKKQMQAARAEPEEEKPQSWMRQNRRWLRSIMRLKRFHLIMIGLVAFDLLTVMIELILALLTASCPGKEQYAWLLKIIAEAPTSEHLKPADFACTLIPSDSRDALELSMFLLNLILLCVFVTEVMISLYAFGPITYCSSWVSLLDGCVVILTLVLDVYFHLRDDAAAKSPIALVILRLWKIFRAVHAIAHALELHYHSVIEAATKGKEFLEWERIAESLRLNYVRRELYKARGYDIEPQVVEELVEAELAQIRQRRIDLGEGIAKPKARQITMSRWRRLLLAGT